MQATQEQTPAGPGTTGVAGLAMAELGQGPDIAEAWVSVQVAQVAVQHTKIVTVGLAADTCFEAAEHTEKAFAPSMS